MRVYTDTDFYIQDTWKVKSNLTLDYGMRCTTCRRSTNSIRARPTTPPSCRASTTRRKAVRLYVPDPANSNLIIDPKFPNSPLPSSLTNILKYTIVPGSGDPRDGVVPLGTAGVGLPGHPRSQVPAVCAARRFRLVAGHGVRRP